MPWPPKIAGMTKLRDRPTGLVPMFANERKRKFVQEAALAQLRSGVWMSDQDIVTVAEEIYDKIEEKFR